MVDNDLLETVQLESGHVTPIALQLAVAIFKPLRGAPHLGNLDSLVVLSQDGMNKLGSSTLSIWRRSIITKRYGHRIT